jgi:hypothetical protein
MFRTDDRQRDASGSGQALAITHEICKRSGWQLSFERESSRGLRVTIQGARRDPVFWPASYSGVASGRTPPATRFVDSR